MFTGIVFFVRLTLFLSPEAALNKLCAGCNFFPCDAQRIKARLSRHRKHRKAADACGVRTALRDAILLVAFTAFAKSPLSQGLKRRMEERSREFAEKGSERYAKASAA